MEDQKPKSNKKYIIIAAVLVGLYLVGKYAPSTSSTATETSKTTEVANYELKATDTVGNAMQVVNRLGGMIMSNRLGDMVAIATANLERFQGADKADILDQRGGAYSMQKDYENAAKDYAMAAELDPTALVHQTNAAETYQSLGNKQKALEFANKVKNNPKASKSDIETVDKVIAALK